MSLNRVATTIGVSAICTIRTTGLSQISAARACSRCLNSHLQIRPRQALPRRYFAAAAQPQPQTFDPPAGPRNTGVPETSIAGGQPVDPINAGHEQRTDAVAPNTSHQAEQNQSIPESEAQTPRPTSNAGKAVGSVASPTPSPQDAQGKPKRKSKLRPRKAAMTLSPTAVKALRELLDQDQKMIRVGVKNRGCSGLAYHLEYVEKPGSFDEAVDQDGVKVLIDSKALFSIIGSEMDWVEDKLSRRFVFKNPNITEQCGCGESFSIG